MLNTSYVHPESRILMEEIEELKKNVDHFFLLINAFFVCLMQCGFACLEAGSIRAKNTTNILMKNVVDIFISCIAYWLIGYAVAYGKGNSFIGWTFWAGIGVSEDMMSHWFFQFVFAATAATIVSGAVAERCNYVAYIVYSFAISGFIYPVVSHWIWSDGGWLTVMGYYDFAGSGAVHLLGGAASFIGAIFLGPRIGRFEGKEMPGHSIPLIATGGLILIAGFLAFNGGSLGNITSLNAGSLISKVIINTVVAGSGASLVTMFGAKLFGPKTWDFCLTLNCALTGMVSVCATVDQYEFWSSCLCGIMSVPVYFAFHHFMLFFKVDDPLDAVAVHFGGGLWALIAGPILKNDGIIYGPNSDNLMLLVYNIVGALAILAWTAGWCVIMFWILHRCNYLRVSEEEELLGLDVTKHNQLAYPSEGWLIGRNTDWRSESQNLSMSSSLGTFKCVQEYSNHAFNCDKNST